MDGKKFSISPSMNQETPFHLLIDLSAEWHPLPGRNPCDSLLNRGSRIASSVSLIACCTILSLGLPTPSGLSFPFDLGMRTFLTGLGRKASFLSLSEICSNHIAETPSNVSESDPFVMFPGLLFIDRYAIFKISGSLRTSNALMHLLFKSNFNLFKISFL